jgi:hypothetical protein
MLKEKKMRTKSQIMWERIWMIAGAIIGVIIGIIEGDFTVILIGAWFGFGIKPIISCILAFIGAVIQSGGERYGGDTLIANLPKILFGPLYFISSFFEETLD